MERVLKPRSEPGALPGGQAARMAHVGAGQGRGTQAREAARRSGRPRARTASAGGRQAPGHVATLKAKLPGRVPIMQTPSTVTVRDTGDTSQKTRRKDPGH